MTPEKRAEIAARLMHRLEVFPAFRPERKPKSAEEYIAALTRMLSDFGSEITFDAVTKVIDHGGAFPPTPAQIREAAQRLKAERQPIEVEPIIEIIDERKFYSCRHGLSIGEPCAECNPQPLSWEEVCERCFSS